MDTRHEFNECCLVMSVEEARRKLGLGRGSMYKAIKHGEIPHLVVGKRILIPKKSFSQWLEGLDTIIQDKKIWKNDL